MHEPREYTWHCIARSIEDLMPAGTTLTNIEINKKKVCLGLYRSKLFACSANCPHAGGDMAAGYIDSLGNIVCPLHRYKFNLENGRNTTGEGYHLKRYPIEIRGDGVFIGF